MTRQTLETRLNDKLLRLQIDATEGAAEAVKASRRELKEGKVQDPARTGRDLQQIGTQAQEKRHTSEGRPTQITANLKDIPEILARLKALAPGLIVEDQPVIEATAEEITEGEGA